MRLDKFLKQARIVKRREISKEFITNGIVFVNGKIKKPPYEVKIGDIIELRTRKISSKFKVINPEPRRSNGDACEQMI